jgi:hypothetical protein
LIHFISIDIYLLSEVDEMLSRLAAKHWAREHVNFTVFYDPKLSIHFSEMKKAPSGANGGQ